MALPDQEGTDDRHTHRQSTLKEQMRTPSVLPKACLGGSPVVTSLRLAGPGVPVSTSRGGTFRCSRSSLDVALSHANLGPPHHLPVNSSAGLSLSDTKPDHALLPTLSLPVCLPRSCSRLPGVTPWHESARWLDWQSPKDMTCFSHAGYVKGPCNHTLQHE